MKTFLVSLIAILTILSINVFYSTSIHETIKPQLDYGKYIGTVQQSSSNVTPTEEPVSTYVPPVFIEPETTVVNEVTYPTFTELLLKYTIEHPQVCFFIYRLREKYPERFEPQTAEASFQKVVSLFDMDKAVPAHIINSVETTFIW